MVELIIIFTCLVLSGVFSASETAYSALNRPRLQIMSKQGKRGAKQALSLYHRYDELLSTILICNNIVNIAMASVGTVLFVRWIGNAGPTASTVVITVAVLILGEITPKSIAKDYPERFACFLAPTLTVLLYIFKPACWLFTQWKKLLSKLFKTKPDTAFSPEELLLLFEESEKEGVIDSDESELLANAVEFSDCIASDVLIKRKDIVGADIRWSKEDIAKRFDKTNYSRLPIYYKNLDNIIGILHVKELLTSDGISKQSVQKLCSAPMFAKPEDQVSDILKTMQQTQSHMCIVQDAKKHTIGLLTMEDILEELVGEIDDETD